MNDSKKISPVGMEYRQGELKSIVRQVYPILTAKSSIFCKK